MNAFKESGGIDYSADVLLGHQARRARAFSREDTRFFLQMANG